MSMQGIIELAWERARDGDHRAGREVLKACLSYLHQLDEDDIEVQVLESILEQVLAGVDAREATWTKVGSGNPRWKRQDRDSLIVSWMRQKTGQGMKDLAAAKELASLKHFMLTKRGGKHLSANTIRNIWIENRDRPDAHITFGLEWEDDELPE